tara:strand:- start:278 stop:475 length:198 start_codon:yes stop_codon:yes gene_type:complete
MQNVTPFPKQTIVTKQKKVKKKPNKPQPFSYIKLTLAVVVGNFIAIACLMAMFIIYLSMMSPVID